MHSRSPNGSVTLAGSGVDSGDARSPFTCIHLPIAEVYSCIDVMGLSEVAKYIPSFPSSARPSSAAFNTVNTAEATSLTCVLGSCEHFTRRAGDGISRGAIQTMQRANCNRKQTVSHPSYNQASQPAHPIRPRAPRPRLPRLLEHVVEHAHADGAFGGALANAIDP